MKQVSARFAQVSALLTLLLAVLVANPVAAADPPGGRAPPVWQLRLDAGPGAIDFLKRGHPDALARAIYGQGLQAQAVAFKKANPEHFATGYRAWLPWLGFLLGALALIGLARLI